MARPKEYDAGLRARLLATTAQVVATNGVDGISLRSLAASADTSTNAIYTLFGSRAGLIHAVVEDASAGFVAAQRAVPPGVDAEQDLRNLGRAYRAWALDHPCLYAVVFAGRLHAADPTGEDDGAQGESRLPAELDPMTPFFEQIQRAMSRGALRPGEPAVVATSIWAGVHGFVSLEIAGWAGIPRAERDARYEEHLGATMSYWMAPGRHPVLDNKMYAELSLFEPENLLREARRQKALPEIAVPEVTLLDPDGDIVRHLASTGRGRRHPGWACYHTEMWVTDLDGVEVGVVGLAVGASFAVLVAEQLVASGAQLVISITSAGLITPGGLPSYFVLIERALRDEGTSGHYLPPGTWSELPKRLAARLEGAYDGLSEAVHRGSSWTTDAPYRETASAVAAAREAGIECVEMEAAALYAYASARGSNVVCLAHITNTMATEGDDFEKGENDGVPAALMLARATAVALMPPGPVALACKVW